MQSDFHINYLRHHGILGMKWGKRNGPPYPLGSSDHSASEKKAGWRKSLDKPSGSSHTKTRNIPKGSDNYEKGVFRLTGKQGKAIKNRAATEAFLADFGTYKLAQSGKLNDLAAIGKSKVDAMLGKKAGNAEFGSQKANDLLGKKAAVKAVEQTVGGIKKLAKPESLEETLKNVNPNRGNPIYDNNCTLCSITSFLRQKGLDVKAGSTGGQMQQLGEKVEECFKGAKIFEGSAVKFGRSRQDAAEMLIKRFGNNASGVVSVQWKGGQNRGHAFNWKIKDGIVSFFDGQENRDDSIVSKYWRMIDPNGGLTIARLDDAEINYEGVKRLLE